MRPRRGHRPPARHAHPRPANLRENRICGRNVYAKVEPINVGAWVRLAASHRRVIEVESATALPPRYAQHAIRIVTVGVWLVCSTDPVEVIIHLGCCPEGSAAIRGRADDDEMVLRAKKRRAV